MSAVTATAGGIGAIAGAILGVLTLGGLVFKWTRPLREMARDWAGIPGRPEDGVDEIPGVMRQLRYLRDAQVAHDRRLIRVESAVSTVRTAVSVNGGDSMRDSINRIEAATVPDQPGGRA